MKRWLKQGGLIVAIATGLVALDGWQSRSAHSAEYLQIGLGLFSVSVSISDLQTFAETGEAPDELETYLGYLPPAGREQFQEALNRQFQVSPVAISQATYSNIGADFLTRLGDIIQTPSGLNGQKAIRAALILSAADPEGLSILGILQAFPAVGIHIDGGRLLTLQQEVSSYFSYRDAALEAIAAQSAAEVAATAGSIDWETVPDLRDRGGTRFTKTVLQLSNQFSDIPEGQARNFAVDLYLPEQRSTATQLVVISHGLGSNRQEFTRMAEHLASYGFAVAVPAHPGSDTNYRQEFLANLSYEGIDPQEFVYRPWDIKTLLNTLADDPTYAQQLDLESVGVIGHSFGGYTALALAGAPLNQEFIQATCDPVQYVLNLSTLLQCRAALLPLADYDLVDERVSAVIAYSPVTSVLLGPENLAQIQKPVMIVTGSGDFVAPAVPEQIHPFVWLETPNKHLAAFIPASHVSINGDVDFGDQVDISPRAASLLTGPDPELSSHYAHALNAAFMGFYLSDRPNYQPFLGAAYAEQYLSEEPVQLKVISELTADQLTEAYGSAPPIAIYPTPRSIRDEND
ncbi:MAG: alpha/beta fold hydrolase [Cyanobacteria bacterium P01_C01_bin.70]